ncbi:MAG: 50S ribosomal protein L10 [Candidatus Nanopelagicales bacterium]|nr:50S ribosomal protein L10 [Candidatus Nanopelagicales bacterium]
MARPTKVTTVADLADHFRTSSATVLTEYRGLTVAQLKELRRSLGDTVTYAVVKNTLTKIAAKDAGVTGIDGLLHGPSAIAFIKGDAVDAAKGIRNFAKANPALVIKGGVMDGVLLSAQEIARLADLESREVLLAKMAYAMKAKQSQAAALFSAPLSKAARALGALQAKLAAAAPVAAAPVADAPVADAPVADAPVADAPVADAPVAEEEVTEEVVVAKEVVAEVVTEEIPEG